MAIDLFFIERVTMGYGSGKVCPNCFKEETEIFYEVSSVPVHSVLLMETKEEALNYPKGNIKLGFCNHCGFITNTAFDKSLHEYSSKYEETQGFSETFSKFHKALAERLIEKHGLRNKEIIEIGCGKGEFLNLICELGHNKGIGFDPAYIDERNTGAAKDHTVFIKDFYSEKYTDYHGDFVACKMTLEHIPETYDFVRTVRKSIGERFETVVFFQVPDVERVLSDFGFWDIYYEHCSYFNAGALDYVFRKAGFNVLEKAVEYGGQYLMIESLPAEINSSETGTPDLSYLKALKDNFENGIRPRLEDWKNTLTDFHKAGKKTVLWGGGSKAVAFLTTLGIYKEIEYAVDINPYKHNTFLAGTGQQIVSPEFLQSYKPDIVIIMNPVYKNEVSQDLSDKGLHPEILTIDFK